MLTALAFCPHPPVLVPDVARGAAAELDDLRAACRAALRRITARRPARIAVLGAGTRSAVHDAAAVGSFAGFGVPLRVSLDGRCDDRPGRQPELPLSLTVGAWLVGDALGPQPDAVAFTVGPDWDGSHAHDVWRTEHVHGDRPLAVVAMGDGSARRSTAAPGYLDPRAEQFDRLVAVALRAGQGHALHEQLLAPDSLGADLLASGVPVWDEVAWCTEAAPWAAELHYDEAPYGVGYFVATWLLADTAR